MAGAGGIDGVAIEPPVPVVPDAITVAPDNITAPSGVRPVADETGLGASGAPTPGANI